MTDKSKFDPSTLDKDTVLELQRLYPDLPWKTHKENAIRLAMGHAFLDHLSRSLESSRDELKSRMLILDALKKGHPIVKEGQPNPEHAPKGKGAEVLKGPQTQEEREFQFNMDTPKRMQGIEKEIEEKYPGIGWPDSGTDPRTPLLPPTFGDDVTMSVEKKKPTRPQ